MFSHSSCDSCYCFIIPIQKLCEFCEKESAISNESLMYFHQEFARKAETRVTLVCFLLQTYFLVLPNYHYSWFARVTLITYSKDKLKLSGTPKLLSQDTDSSHSIEEVSLLHRVQCMIAQEASVVCIYTDGARSPPKPACRRHTPKNSFSCSD